LALVIRFWHTSKFEWVMEAVLPCGYLIGPDPICIVAVESILCEACFFKELTLRVCSGGSFAFAFEYMGARIKFGNCRTQESLVDLGSFYMHIKH
jgi:hypothetical protein